MKMSEYSVKKKTSPMISKEEMKFLSLSKKYPERFIHAHEDSKQEGFEYFYSNMTMKTLLGFISRFLHIGEGLDFINRIKMFRAMIRNFRTIFKGREQSYEDLEPYYQKIEKSGDLSSSKNQELIEEYPNRQLWEDLVNYAKQNWGINLGFTKLPTQLIFKGKAVLFRHAIVCIQEMQKEMIKHAPNSIAGAEVMRVYGSLGLAVNDIAQWLRSKGINSQANHPLGGLVNLPPLAAKAGMGWQGRHGLLITPEFGPRHRIAPIFIAEKVFKYTDNQKHEWIEQWCDKCGKCKRACPTSAIKSKKEVSIRGIPGIGSTRTCINREKCFPYFNKTFGCSVCIKVCPFSNGIETYNRLKKAVKKKKD
jgi:ferredoxin